MTLGVKTLSVKTHWASDYIGKPWKAGCAGPDAFNCWGLVVDVYRRFYGKTLESIPVPENNLKALIKTVEVHPERYRWEATSIPKEGDVALLRQSRYPTHVGLWVEVDGGGILHCIQGTGVVFQSLQALELSGWKIENFYKYVGKPSDTNRDSPQPISAP